MDQNDNPDWDAAMQGATEIVRAEPRMAIALGARKEIQEIAYRIRRMAPGGMKYTPEEAIVLAQYAASLQANPFTGEVWLMKNFRTGEVVGLTPGIRLYRRRADEQDAKNNDTRWIEFEWLTEQDRELFGVPKDAMAIRAKLYNKSVISAYADNAETFRRAGAKWADTQVMLGGHPYTEGIGVLTRAELDALDRNSSNKMPHIERLKKRAEAAALKARYHLDFGFIPLDGSVQIERGTLAEDFIDVRANPVAEDQGADPEAGAGVVLQMAREAEGERAPDPNKSDEQRAVELQRAGAGMWQGMEKPKKRNWQQATLDYVTGAYEMSGDDKSVALLDLSCLDVYAPLDDVKYWCGVYYAAKKSGKTAAQSAKIANADYQKTKGGSAQG